MSLKDLRDAIERDFADLKAIGRAAAADLSDAGRHTHPEQWEYAIDTVDDVDLMSGKRLSPDGGLELILQKLDHRGQHGWQVCAHIGGSLREGYLQVLLKRRRVTPPA